jgi:acetyl-CoA synthetase
VILVSDLPKTRNMKIMRRVVRAVYKGESPGDLSSLVNPEAVTELQARIAA